MSIIIFGTVYLILYFVLLALVDTHVNLLNNVAFIGFLPLYTYFVVFLAKREIDLQSLSGAAVANVIKKIKHEPAKAIPLIVLGVLIAATYLYGIFALNGKYNKVDKEIENTSNSISSYNPVMPEDRYR